MPPKCAFFFVLTCLTEGYGASKNFALGKGLKFVLLQFLSTSTDIIT